MDIRTGASAQPPSISEPKDLRQAARTGIDKAARQFEEVFVAQMLEHMFAGIKTDGEFGGGHAEGTWRSFLIQEYAKQISGGSGIGIAGAVRDQLTEMLQSTAADSGLSATPPLPTANGQASRHPDQD
jgi:Rod binding domain-containing protein